MITKVELTKKAQKDLEKVPKRIAIKFLAWVDAVENDGLEKVREISGYHDEPLSGKRSGQRSVRLNRSYRAIYRIVENYYIEFVRVEEVNKHDY